MAGETVTQPVVQERPTGAAVAAVLAAVLALFVFALVNFAAIYIEGAPNWLRDDLGGWIPSNEGIGPYSGKITALLIAYVILWPTLHFSLRKRNPNLKVVNVVFLVLLAISTLLFWPPLVED